VVEVVSVEAARAAFNSIRQTAVAGSTTTKEDAT
jgi:hypothetical protein